jgi:hypothetical protein
LQHVQNVAEKLAFRRRRFQEIPVHA